MVVISEDLDELMELSDRIAVLHNGHITGIVDPNHTDVFEIGRLMLGTDHGEVDVDATSRERSARSPPSRTPPTTRRGDDLRADEPDDDEEVAV